MYQIWILTGDKTETAVDVANSVSLLDSSLIRFSLTDHVEATSCSKAIDNYLNQIEQITNGKEITPDSKQFAVIIDGKTLFIAMKNHKLPFQSLCLKCSAVICARMSPIQKAEVINQSTILEFNSNSINVLLINRLFE